LGELWVRAARAAFRRTAPPLASYYAVTLALPLANGAAQSGAFVKHALVVLVVPPIAIILACTVYRVAHALVRACRAAGAALRPLSHGSLGNEETDSASRSSID
jgi:hypothetical protein